MKILQPSSWPRPKGYSNGVEANGRQVFVAGMIGWDEQERIVSDRLPDQVDQALRNMLAVLAEAGAGAKHVARMTWYITDRSEYLEHAVEIGRVYREAMGSHYPAMSMIVVSALMEPGAKVEIEATAVLES